MFIEFLAHDKDDKHLLVDTDKITHVEIKTREEKTTPVDENDTPQTVTVFDLAEVYVVSGAHFTLDETNYEILKQVIMPQNEQS